jgi:hypothetical protein
MSTTCTRSIPHLLRLGVRAALAAAVVAPGAAGAIDFTAGGWNGSLNTTVTYGEMWRGEARDPRLIGTANGGSGRSPNIDDGDLNYRQGRVSSAFKLVSEFALDRDSYGLFVRGSALYDDLVEDADTERTEISKSGRNLAGAYVRLLDAFAYGRWDLGGHELEIRAGRQVVNWGESTFIQGGINNAINHFDVSALRVPGSELREAYLPQEILKLSYAFSENLTGEVIGIFDWNRTQPEPVGTYFSSNDFVPRGGEKVILGFGAFSDQGVDFTPLGGTLISDFQAVPRGPTQDPDDQGQYGASLRWFLPEFGSGTELGLYFLKYHSKLPLISGRAGTPAGVCKALGALTAVGAAARGLAAGLPPAGAIGVGASAGSARSRGPGSLAGTVNCTGNADFLSTTTAAQYATIAVNTALGGGNVTAQANNLGVHEYAKTAQYFTQYPEDIQMLGVSFNTSLGTTGIALQGELSYRMDQPLQFDDVELLFAALTPFEAAALTEQGLAIPATCADDPLTPTVDERTLNRCNQLGAFAADQVVQGWGEFDVWQAQMTATKAFPPMLGASQLVAVVEAGVTRVDGMPDKLTGGPNGRGLRLNGPGTSVSGNAELASRHFGEVEPQDRFADETSWGYRAALRLDYLGLIGAWNFSPRFVWSHDVSGTTPGPGGNFVEGRYGATLGVGASYQSKLELDLSYTVFGGASRYNELTDRDFVAATIKYSF